MMKLRQFSLLSVLVCIAMLYGAIPARAASAPLIMIINGDLWTWTGAAGPLQQITTWGYNQTPVISPDAKKVAYLSTAAIRAAQYRKGNFAFDGDGPMNIWVIDLATGDATRVADQPPGASDAVANGWYVGRREPAWAPDSKQLAWTDLTCCNQTAPDGSAGPWQQLVIYNWGTKNAQTTVNQLPFGPIRALTNPTSLDWGLNGLVFTITAEPDAAYVYAPDGTQRSKFMLVDCTTCGNAHWIKNNGQDLIMVDRASPDSLSYLLVDPASNQTVTDKRRPERYSLSAPDGMILYRDGADWFDAQPGQPPLDLGEGSPDVDWISIAPDGKQAAFVSKNKAYLVSDGQITEIPVGDGKSVTGVAWSAMGWRLGQT